MYWWDIKLRQSDYLLIWKLVKYGHHTARFKWQYSSKEIVELTRKVYNCPIILIQSKLYSISNSTLHPGRLIACSLDVISKTIQYDCVGSKLVAGLRAKEVSFMEIWPRMEKKLGAGNLYCTFICLIFISCVPYVIQVPAGLWHQKSVLVRSHVLYRGSAQHPCASRPWVPHSFWRNCLIAHDV